MDSVFLAGASASGSMRHGQGESIGVFLDRRQVPLRRMRRVTESSNSFVAGDISYLEEHIVQRSLAHATWAEYDEGPVVLRDRGGGCGGHDVPSQSRQNGGTGSSQGSCQNRRAQ